MALDAWGTDLMRPWVEDHIHMDGDRVDALVGTRRRLDAPLPSDLILDAAQERPEIMASAGGYLSMAALPASLREAEPIAREVYAGGWRPAYSPGRSRDELAEIVAEGAPEPQRVRIAPGLRMPSRVEGVLDPAGQGHHVRAELVGQRAPPWPGRRRARR